MDNEWKWQQENVKLQREVERLRSEFAAYKVSLIPEAKTRDSGIFTKPELDFIHENNLNYSRVYALVHRYEETKDALIETLEGIL